MMPSGEILADVRFTAEAFEWRGPAPFVFVAVPEEHTGEVRYAARLASYGWGVVPVSAEIGGISFRTSLFPRDGAYLLPLKVAVRKATGIVLGDLVTVRMRIANAY
ncbi:DUF1905 domain-containing protein [Sphingomonas sp. G-3-2-10]|uniref:DUF1905 domain-containing protein n=1 Tax=Sphingomonas sp. G-3-2-10 TaxID=2728838 RepID=UPI001F0FCD36|nr:DUF1905 domain-containing protein [Sphingomonas sp. G-3-2-10]